MKKKVRFGILLVLTLFFVFGCKNNTTPPEKEVDIYVSGVTGDSSYSRAVYWKNGQKTELSTTESEASDIIASGSDVYISGYDKNGDTVEHACYWKNGTRTILSTTPTETKGECIAVSGSDVYVGGTDYIKVSGSDINQARYWKNSSNEVVLSQSVTSDDTIVNDILLDGADVLCAGHEYKSSKENATAWKNDSEKFLSTSESSLSTLAISGSDIYYGGQVNNGTATVATIWKEDNTGAITVFATLSNKESNVYDMVFSGRDLYVVGYESAGEGATEHYEIKVWKNGSVLQTLSDGNSNLLGVSIAIHGEDIYVVGYEDDVVLNKEYAILFKNEVKTVLNSGTDYSKANGIVVVEK